MTERKAGHSYTWEELLSFDRLKRSLRDRVLDTVEDMWQKSEPISAEQISEIINAEWGKAKEAVRSSPAAREAFRKYLERTVSEQIEQLVRKEKDELESLGVVEIICAEFLQVFFGDLIEP